MNDAHRDKCQIITIVAFGDSTTAPRNDIREVYSFRLEKDLQASGLRVRVINDGIPGSHTGSVRDNNFHNVLHGLDRFDKNVLSCKPDWVIINFGINDSWQYKSEREPSVISLRQYSKNIIYFIEGIQKNNGRVILITPNPIGEQYEKWRSNKLESYRKEIKRLGKVRKLPVVDTWNLFGGCVTVTLDSLLLDGMHPNDKGHAIITKALSEIIMNGEGKYNTARTNEYSG